MLSENIWAWKNKYYTLSPRGLKAEGELVSRVKKTIVKDEKFWSINMDHITVLYC